MEGRNTELCSWGLNKGVKRAQMGKQKERKVEKTETSVRVAKQGKEES